MGEYGFQYFGELPFDAFEDYYKILLVESITENNLRGANCEADSSSCFLIYVRTMFVCANNTHNSLLMSNLSSLPDFIEFVPQVAENYS